MSSVWKNKTFSEGPKTETLSPKEDIYRDYNYKNIPDIYDKSPSTSSEYTPSNIVIENMDSSALDKDDNADSKLEISSQEIIINSMEDVATTLQNALKSIKLTPVPEEETDEILLYIQAVNRLTNDIKSQVESVRNGSNVIGKIYFIISLAISYPSKIFELTITLFANLYLNYLNNVQIPDKLDKKSSEYKHLQEIAKIQFRNFVSILISLWIAINWWWLFSYTFSYISFAKLLDIPLLNIVLESLLMFVNVINYVLLGFKQDDYRLVIPEYICKGLWIIRPIVFVVFLGIIQSIIINHRASIERLFEDAVARKSNVISGFNAGCFFFSFIKMDVFNPVRFLLRVTATTSFIVAVFFTIFKLLFVLAFLPLGVVFAHLYLVIMSFFGILLFNGTGIIIALRTMMMDLTSTVPDTNDTEENILYTIWRVVMNTMVYVGISMMFIGVFSHNLNIIQNVPQKNATCTAMLIISAFALVAAVLGSIANLWRIIPANYVKVAQKLA